LNFGGLVRAVKESDLARTFCFDDMNDRRDFFKQFLGGVFTMIALTGLDQDFMQRNLSCKNSKDSQKNIITSSLMQFVINLLFLVLGVILYLFTARNGIRNPEKSDELFTMIATGGYFPIVVGILFIVGLISSAYATAGSALTALTTSFTIDILGVEGKNEDEVRRLRKKVHFGMMAAMGVVIFIFGILNNKTVIDAVYTIASYTYGPIVGMFTFGIVMKRRVRDKYIPIVAVVSPILCYVIQHNSERWFNGYQFSYELLLINALFTFLGMWALSKRKFL
jgi:Na+/proline symporter